MNVIHLSKGVDNMENIDEKNLVPATDKEINEAIDRVFAEMDAELDEMFSDETLEREYGDYMKEFGKATTVEERTAVMDKYGINYQI